MFNVVEQGECISIWGKVFNMKPKPPAFYVSEIAKYFNKRAVAILYIWLVSVGTQTIHSGDRHLVDCKDRCDFAILQIGLRFIERGLTNALSFKIPLCS